MQLSANDSIILSYDEVRILLYSLGFTSCKGIYMPEKEFTAREVLQIMHRLTARGLLEGAAEDVQSATENKFVIKQRLRHMMMAMGNPAGTFIYRPGESFPGFSEELYNGPEYFCYTLPDYYLVTECDWTRSESMRLRAMNMVDFALWQEEREQEAKEQLLVNQIETGQGKDSRQGETTDILIPSDISDSMEPLSDTVQALNAIL